MQPEQLLSYQERKVMMTGRACEVPTSCLWKGGLLAESAALTLGRACERRNDPLLHNVRRSLAADLQRVQQRTRAPALLDNALQLLYDMGVSSAFEAWFRSATSATMSPSRVINTMRSSCDRRAHHVWVFLLGQRVACCLGVSSEAKTQQPKQSCSAIHRYSCIFLTRGCASHSRPGRLLDCRPGRQEWLKLPAAPSQGALSHRHTHRPAADDKMNAEIPTA